MLVNGKATHKMTFQYDEIVRAIGILPRYGIDGIISRNKQNAVRLSVKRTPGCRLLGKQCLVDSLAISDRIVEGVCQSIVARNDRKQIKGVRASIITGYANLRS